MTTDELIAELEDIATYRLFVYKKQMLQACGDAATCLREQSTELERLRDAIRIQPCTAPKSCGCDREGISSVCTPNKFACWRYRALARRDAPPNEG